MSRERPETSLLPQWLVLSNEQMKSRRIPRAGRAGRGVVLWIFIYFFPCRISCGLFLFQYSQPFSQSSGQTARRAAGSVDMECRELSAPAVGPGNSLRTILGAPPFLLRPHGCRVTCLLDRKEGDSHRRAWRRAGVRW